MHQPTEHLLCPSTLPDPGAGKWHLSRELADPKTHGLGATKRSKEVDVTV